LLHRPGVIVRKDLNWKGSELTGHWILSKKRRKCTPLQTSDKKRNQMKNPKHLRYLGTEELSIFLFLGPVPFTTSKIYSLKEEISPTSFPIIVSII